MSNRILRSYKIPHKSPEQKPFGALVPLAVVTVQAFASLKTRHKNPIVKILFIVTT